MDNHIIEPMNPEAAKQICSWQYEPPYSVYNYMTYEEALKAQAMITRSENAENYLCFWNDKTLVAYTSIIPKDESVFIGIGIAPPFCGRDLGKIFINKTLLEAQKRFPDKEIWVQVRSRNERAIKCYKSCGFKEKLKKIIKDRFENYEEFIFMCQEKK